MGMPADLIAVVLSHSDVTAIIENRVFPNKVPSQVWDSGDQRPCLCYFTEIDEPDTTFCGTDDLRAERYTFHCSAGSFDVARALGDALMAALTDYSAVSGDTAIENVFLEATMDDPPDSEPGAFSRMVQFLVWHRSN